MDQQEENNIKQIECFICNEKIKWNKSLYNFKCPSCLEYGFENKLACYDCIKKQTTIVLESNGFNRDGTEKTIIKNPNKILYQRPNISEKEV